MDFSAFAQMFALREQFHDRLSAIGQPDDTTPLDTLKQAAKQRESLLRLSAAAKPVSIHDVIKAASAPLQPLVPEKPLPAGPPRSPAAKARKRRNPK